jgi:serine/threonine protein kinase
MWDFPTITFSTLALILSAIGFAHAHGIIHGAVLPPHILLRPVDHGAYLLDWTNATQHGYAAYLSTPYAGWYPPEVREQKRLLPATDIYLAAKCAIYLLGGDPLAETFPDGVPERWQRFLRSCLLKSPAWRPQNAWDLHEEFDECIVRPSFGEPQFVEFMMA